jgi:hypothetical protein
MKRGPNEEMKRGPNEERTEWRDEERTEWRLFQKHNVRTTLNIYVFYYLNQILELLGFVQKIVS